MTNEVAMRRQWAARGKVVNVKVGIQLQDHGPCLTDGLFIDGEGGNVTAPQPEEEILRRAVQERAGGLSTGRAPSMKGHKAVKGVFFDAKLFGVGVGSGGHHFATVIGHDFAKLIGNQFRPGTGPGTAKTIKRKHHHRGTTGAGLGDGVWGFSSGWCHIPIIP